MENTVTPSTEETKEQTVPTLEKIAELNSLDKEFLDYTKGNLSVDPEASFKWLDDWSERRFGIRGEKGSAWLGSRKEYPNPNAYADALTGLVTRGYEAIATPEYNAYIAAEKSGNRAEMIKLAKISLTKRGTNIADTISPIESQSVRIADIPKTDEEIDNELKEYGKKIKLQNFSAHFLTFADDFTPDEKEIVYASLRYGDGLPAEKEADYLAVWRDNPEKAARLHYLVELSRKNEYAWMRDNLIHPFVTGIENIRYGIGDELGDFAEFQGAISAMKEIVSRDGERRMWNDAERKIFRDLETRKTTWQMELNRRGLGNSAAFQTFTSAADEGVANPKAYVDDICARRMAREALPREEQLKRRKEELMLRLATSHKPYDNYDPISNAISGAIGTLPYMAVAAVPYAGIAINTLAQFGNVRNDIIMNGGNPDEGIGTQFLLAAGWSAIEKQQFLTFTKPLTGLQKKAILERIAQTAWKNGKLGALGSAIRQGAPEFVAKTFAECVEEGLQGAVEGGTKQWWMPEEKGGGDWAKTISAALTQGGKDFVESIGTMGLLSLVGGGINQTQARRNALSAESLVDYAGKRMQVMNIMSGRVKEMADEKNIPANAQKMHTEVVQIWEAHKGNAVAALDEMREKYGLTDDQARTIGDYLDLRSTLLNIARTSETDEEAASIAAFAGGAYRVGQTTGMGDTAYDITDLFRMISPNITVEDIEVDDMTKAPIASPAVENLRQERDAAVKRVEEAKVGSQRKAAERELRRINKRLKAAEAKENAVSYPKMTMRRVTIPVGKNGETRSFVIREDNEAPDIHSAGYAISVSDAVRGSEDAKDGRKVSLAEFKALSKEDKKRIAVTPEQYMAMTNEEREDYVSGWSLGSSGSFSLLDENNREIFNSDAIVKLFRGKLGTPGTRIGGNWTLAHEYTHGIVRFLRDMGAIDEGTVALMQKLFGAPVAKDELWNEEAMANGFAEFLRGEFDFRRLTPEERREAMGFFERVWDIIKDFFRRIFGKEIDEPPVVANTRKEAERAVFNALRNGDLSGLDQYAGIEFEEENGEQGTGNGERMAQGAQEATSKPSEEKTANEPPKSEERAPTASTPLNTAKDAPKEPAKEENAPAPTPITDVAAVVEQIENPIATATNLPARTNTKKTIFTPGYEMEIECEMMWVPLAELAESTDDREVQMRDRTRRATDEQVRSKTRKGVFQPLALFPGKKSDDGAPIVGGGMKIISGHGRKRMLEQLASEGRFGEYLSAINAEAQRKGVPTAPEGMKNPVLVLRVTGGLDKKSDLNRFAELSNRWGGLERSGAELAESDARKITDALLRLYNPDSSGNLLAASNRSFMAAFLKEVGATGLTNADGTPTPEAALRVQRALMTAIFGNDEKIRAIIQNLLEKSGELSLGNLQNALMRSAGKLLAMKRAKGSFDIVNDVREAAYHYIAWRSAQQKQKSLSFADYLSEQDMFAEVATPMQEALAKLLEVGRFGTVLDEYSKLVAQEAVDAQGAFDFAEKRTPLQLLGYAERNTLAPEETPVTPDPTSAEARFSVTIAQAQREYDDVVSRFTNPDGTHKAGWMKAPNGKPTKLTEHQWVQVRTPSFKKWFGDWENVLRRNKLDAARVVHVKAGAFVRKDGNTVQQTAKALFPTAREYSTDIGKVTIDARSAHTSLSHGYSQKKLDALVSIQDDFNNAVYIGSEPDFDGKDIANHYFAYPIEYGEDKERNYVFCRAREDKNANRLYLHEVLLESDVKNKGDAFQTAAASSLKDASHTNASPVKKPQGAFLPRIILQRLFAVNPSSVSKVVDENGEPLVVAHSTNAVFTIFRDMQKNDAGWLGAGFYFFGDRSLDGQYGRNVMECFLNIRNPYRLSDYEHNELVEVDDAERSREFADELRNEGYDGVYYNGDLNQEYAVFSPPQIKSATDNTGAFDGTNADIRYSVGGVYTGSAADYEKPSLHYVGKSNGVAFGWGLYGSSAKSDAENFGDNIYEQTFFTNRPKGDESHLIDWEKPLTEENKNRILDGLVYEARKNKAVKNAVESTLADEARDFGLDESEDYEPESIEGMADDVLREAIERTIDVQTDKGRSVYTHLAALLTGKSIGEVNSFAGRLDAFKAASEFLRDECDIDGIKYPAEADGAKHGETHYVSFRDDNIRVDHKWVDGEQRFSIATLGKYRTDDLRSLAHRVKDGDAEAIAEAGRRLAVILPPDAVLVPMPSHTGEPTTMRLLADAIAANANAAKVVDALRSNAHESNYAQKKRGEEPAGIEMRKVADIPENAEVYIVDNVIDTGATYSAAMKAIPNAHILALADTYRTPREMHSMTRSIAEIDAQDGTNLQRIGELVAEVKERGEKPRGRQGHFNLSKTPEFLKNILSGEYFTVKAGVILDHFGKDPDHSLTIEDWAKISEALHDPLVIAKYSFVNKAGKRYYPPKSYRIWVEAVINGHWAVVGVEVKSPSRNIDVNAVDTVYGDERISLNPEDIVYSRNNEEGIRTLLGGPNSHEYSESPSTTHIISNSLSENNGHGRSPEERHHVRALRKTYIGDVVEAYVASQRLAGADVNVEDVNALLKNVGLRHTTPQEVIDAADKLVQTDKAKANALINRNLPELVEYVRRTNMEGELNKALSDAVTMGAKAANPETGRKLQQAIERKRIRDLQTAEGFTAAEIMAELPISLADGVLATAELERTPEELARIEEAKKKREEERQKALETEEGAEELADPETPMRDPTEAERKAVDDLLDRARMRDDLAKQEEERKRAEKAKRDAEESEGGESDAGGDAADDIPLLPEEAVRRIAPVFESADVFSWFIIELTSDKTLEKHPELPSTGEMWKSPVAVRELKKTAADILRRLAKDTLGSPSINYAPNLVDRAINELESDLETKTFNSVRHKIAHIYEMIWDNAHRITKNELMEELEKTVSKLTQKGRFSYTQEELDRKIPAKIARWAKWVLKYARMGEAKLQDEIANLEKLTSENPAGEDGKMPTPIELAEAADKLAVAKVYGHLKGKTTGEMRDLIDQIAAKLDGERQAFELRRAKIEEANKTIVDALVNALTQGKANRRKRAKAQGIVDRAMAAMISSIDQQMVDLVRFCTDPGLRKKALEAIDELTILINEGGNRYRNTLATAQEEIHDGLKACYGDAAKGIRHLHEELPPEIVEQFFRQSSDQKRTYGHLLQLYASCLQRDYAENIHKHGRDEQIAAMEAALTAQDKMFHTWAVNWYKHNRQALSDAVEEVTGLPVIAPDDLYVPVRVETEPSGIPAEVVAWSPVPRALSRRVRHGLDFDENAHFLTMLNEQAETRAQTIGYAMTGIILRDTIASRDVQTAARRNASPSDMNAVILHLRDILAQDVGKERSEGEIFLKFLRKWAARFNIAWNPSSALAQPASIPVWANVLLDGKAWGAISVLEAMSTAATEEGRAAIAELRASDGYRARYKLGWSEEVANVYANPNEPKLLSKLGAAYDKGMILSQFTDAACSLWIAQGFYRHATDVFVRRGETVEEAKRKALALTWAAVEQTQQSGRIENLSAIQRGRGKNWVNAALQFKTAQILQNSYIIRAIRDVRAGVPGAKGRLARAMFISTVWVPGYLSLKGALWALIMGVKPEPDDEDEMPLWFREMLYSAADGMTAPLFVTSLFVEKPLREMLDLKSYPRRTGFASIDTIKKLAYDTYDLLTDPIMLEEELTTEKIIDDIWKVIGDTFAPARHVRKAINNRRED